MELLSRIFPTSSYVVKDKDYMSDPPIEKDLEVKVDYVGMPVFITFSLFLIFSVHNFCCVPKLVNEKLGEVSGFQQSLGAFRESVNRREERKKNPDRARAYAS